MRKRIFYILMCIVICISLLPTSIFAEDSDVVNVPDPALKQYLNSMLGHDADADLTEADMKSIKRFDYSGSYGRLTDLEGIQYCTELTFFRINGGGSPNNCQLLENCKKLTFLAIMRSGLKDISFVSGLTELTYIDFYNCEISDISAIANLTKLTVLDVMGNHILDMSALSGIYPQMTHLYGLNESATLTLNCTDEENGYCIIKNPVIGIDAAPVAPDSLTGCEYDTATDTFKIPTGTTSFSFTTSQQTVANSADFQNYFKTSVKVNINHPPKTGSLTVSKKLEGNSTEPDKRFTFDIILSDDTVNGSFGETAFVNGAGTVTLGDGESVTISGLPDQIGFTVTETDPGDYICSAPNGISGTIDYQTPATAAFTNTRNVFYHVSYLVNEDANYGIPDDATAPVDSRQYASNESVTVADPLSSSQSYGIEQTTGKQIPGIWSFTPWDKTDFQIAENTTITGAWTFTPTPTPNPKVGNLTVSKTISGNAADSTKAFDFTVTLGDTSINGTYGDMSFTNGVATFTLKGGESKTATNLPAGTTFTVAEADYSADGYVTTKSGDTGTITDGKTATAAFTNMKNTTTPTPTPKPTDPTTPKTGDNSNLALWIMLLAASVAGMTRTAIWSKKRKKTN